MPLLRSAPIASAASRLRRARLAAAAQAQTTPASQPSRSDEHEISDLSIFRLREPVSGRRYGVIKVRTRSGLTGFGETSSVSVEDFGQAKPSVLGRSATAYEVMRLRLDAWPNVQAAVNTALLDILGKLSNAPIYQVLGGPTRNKVRVITPLRGDSDAALIESMRHTREAGFRAFLVPLPRSSARNQGQAFVRAVRKRFDQLRAAGGEDVDFVLSGAGALSPGDASSVAAELERFHLLWFDEPCRISNLSTLRKIANETVTPLGLGRDTIHAGDFQDLLREDVIDVLRPSLSLNGLAAIRKMAALAEAYYVAIAPHHDGGPVGVAATLHLAASMPNFFIQQIPWPEAEAEADRKMRAELMNGWSAKVLDGYAELPMGPGLGVTIQEASFEKFKDAAA